MRYRPLSRLASAAALTALLAGPAATAALAQQSDPPAKKSAPARPKEAGRDTRRDSRAPDVAGSEQAPRHIIAGQGAAPPAPAPNTGPFSGGSFRGDFTPVPGAVPGAVPGPAPGVSGTLFQFMPGVGFVPLGAGVPGTGTVVDPFGNPALGGGSLFQGGPGAGYPAGGGYFPGFTPGITTFGGYYPYFPGYVTSGVPESWITGRPLGASVDVRYTSPWAAFAQSGRSFNSVARQAPARGAQAGARPRIQARFEPAPEDIRAGSPVRNPEEQEVANRARAVMADQPLVEGQVIAAGATGMQVRYKNNGELHTGRFDLDRVFFFREGDLVAADTAPGVLREGDRVLVPLPAPPAQSVAGTREEGPRRVTPPAPAPPRAPRAPKKPRGR